MTTNQEPKTRIKEIGSKSVLKDRDGNVIQTTVEVTKIADDGTKTRNVKIYDGGGTLLVEQNHIMEADGVWRLLQRPAA